MARRLELLSRAVKACIKLVKMHTAVLNVPMLPNPVLGV